MNIDFFISFDSHKIYFLFVKNTDINFISSAEKFNCNNIFKHPAVIHILCAELGITESMVRKIVFIVSRKVLLAFNIVSANLVKSKSVAEILYIITDSIVINFLFFFIKV